MPSTPERCHKLLFTDWRNLRCGHLHWLTPTGERFGVANPSGPEVRMRGVPAAVPRGVRLVAQSARKIDPLDDWKAWGRIIYDQGRYRSWFLEVDGSSVLGTGSASQRPDRRTVAICRVGSEDGIAWTTPQRCEIEVPGQSGFDGVTFLIDPVAPARERYKFIYCARPPQDVADALFADYLQRPARYQDSRIMRGGRYAVYCAVSEDGDHWIPVERPLMMHYGDTDNTVYWDADLERYVMYTRMMRDERRWVGRAEADDFRQWGPVEPVLWPRLDDPPDYDIYLNGRSEYPGLPRTHLMFPLVWHRGTERSEIRLYSSADGIAFSEVPGGAVIAPGEVGAWDSEFIGGGKDLVPFGADRIAIPYTGTSYPHKYPRWPAVWAAWRMGWAWWPRDRLCALVADHEGEFCTMPVVPAGRQLRLNFRTPRAGEVRVGIVGVEGRGIEACDPLQGDSMGQTVTWRGEADTRVPNGEPVSLYIKLRCAELFALEWG